MSNTLALATETFVVLLCNLRPLFMAFLLPEVARLSYYFADSWLAARASLPFYFPDWISGGVDDLLTAITFVATIRFLVLGEWPALISSGMTLRPSILAALVLVPFWFVLNRVADQQMLFSFFYSSLESDNYDGFVRLHYLIGVYCFVVHALLIALCYPALGQLATLSRLNMQTLLQWYRYNFFSIVALTALLVAVEQVLEWGYWSAIDTALPDILSARPMFISDFDSRVMMIKQLLHVPTDFLKNALSAVAIALLHLGLSRPLCSTADSVQASAT